MKIKKANKITLIIIITLILINILYPTSTKGVNLEDKKNIGNITENVTKTENQLYNMQQETNQESQNQTMQNNANTQQKTKPETEKLTSENSQEFYLDSIGMKIYIDKNLIEVISGLKTGDERLNSLENKEEYQKMFNNDGILLDAVDKLGNSVTKEIMVSETTNATYMLMQDLNTMEEKQIQSYFEAFVNSIKSSAQSSNSGELNITNSNLLKTTNGNVYFHITAETTVEEKNVKLSLYYTIKNQKLITISNRYIESEIDETQENTLIENITIDSLPRNTEIEWQIRLSNYLSIALVIIIGIVILIVRKKDKKKLDKEIEDKTIKSYKQFGGILILFWLICIFQIIMTSIDITGLKNLTNIDFRIITIIIQDIAILLINLYMLIKELKVEKDTPKKLSKALITLGIITITLTIIRNTYIGFTEPNISITNLLLQTFYSIFSNVMYVIILAGYLHYSQRVKIYYGLSEKIEYVTFEEFKTKLKNQWKNKKNKNKKNKN